MRFKYTKYLKALFYSKTTNSLEGLGIGFFCCSAALNSRNKQPPFIIIDDHIKDAIKPFDNFSPDYFEVDKMLSKIVLYDVAFKVRNELSTLGFVTPNTQFIVYNVTSLVGSITHGTAHILLNWLFYLSAAKLRRKPFHNLGDVFREITDLPFDYDTYREEQLNIPNRHISALEGYDKSRLIRKLTQDKQSDLRINSGNNYLQLFYDLNVPMIADEFRNYLSISEDKEKATIESLRKHIIAVDAGLRSWCVTALSKYKRFEEIVEILINLLNERKYVVWAIKKLSFIGRDAKAALGIIKEINAHTKDEQTKKVASEAIDRIEKNENNWFERIGNW